MYRLLLLCLALVFFTQSDLLAQKKSAKTTAEAKKPDKPMVHQAGTYSGLRFRSVGPAVTSGRISDFAVNPDDHDEYYVATSSGGVWKTTNHGTTYEPIFDGQGSYSIGCVSLDPNNPHVVWVGTGENNNQRSVGYGDGVYKSTDAGKTWKHMGLKKSEHIANIIVDPTNPQVVWVGAYGPVWSDGGERGVYKSTDGGETWVLKKSVSDYTGCSNLIMDPRDPNTLYAAFHQRQRKVFTYIGGGPESGVFKTTDGGETWTKLSGLPGGDVGRIGIDLFRGDPDYMYAVVEAPEGKGGIYRSTDRGASWEKRSSYYTSGNYYQELTCDPTVKDRIYITDVYYKVSDDGGKTVRNLGEINKHIDNHVIWIDPTDGDHLLVGCDGGIYETWDYAKTWHFKPNLPVTQFYKVSTDNDVPFYHIHGGTQDNLSLGGPSRTTSINGIPNDAWYVTSTGDGFETQVDPTDPNIIYAQSQYGGLSRFDRRSGEYLFIKPIEGENEPALRWNWDAPLTISTHQHTRLYFGANRLYRTDDRGNTWRAISPDLSRQIDRNRLKVMGKVWSVDAIAKNGSTDIFGQLTTIAESTLDENLLWVGTDDGLIHVTTNGGQSWTKIDKIAGVPEMTYVNQIIASQFDKNTAYAAFNHHRYGDFKPYLFKTTDGGRTWTSLSATLPERGSVYTVAEDHVDRNLLFCGTEFGVFFSQDGGKNWVQLKAGLPTIAVRDIEIQRRENDLVLGTFGRGFYVLDDYTPLRSLTQQTFDQAATIFPVKDAWLYVERYPLGLRAKGHLGSSFYLGENPAPGAVFTYYLKDELKTLKDKRVEREKDLDKENAVYYYPSIDTLRLEDAQPDPFLLFTITDAAGEVIRQIKTSGGKGLKRIVWDMRHSTQAPVEGRYTPAPDVLFGSAETGPLAIPGTYNVSLSKYEDGVLTQLSGPVSFKLKPIEQASLPVQDWQAYEDFTQRVARMRRAVSAANDIRGDLSRRIGNAEKAALDMDAPPAEVLKKTYELKRRLNDVTLKLVGDQTLGSREFETPPSISSRIGVAQYGMWDVTTDPTTTFKENIRIAEKQFGPVLEEMKAIDTAVESLEKTLEMQGAPYTPGRWPEWSKE